MERVRMRIPESHRRATPSRILLVLADLAKMASPPRKTFRVGRFPRYKQLKEDGKLTVRITEWLHSPNP